MLRSDQNRTELLRTAQNLSRSEQNWLDSEQIWQGSAKYCVLWWREWRSLWHANIIIVEIRIVFTKVVVWTGIIVTKSKGVAAIKGVAVIKGVAAVKGVRWQCIKNMVGRGKTQRTWTRAILSFRRIITFWLRGVRPLITVFCIDMSGTTSSWSKISITLCTDKHFLWWWMANCRMTRHIQRVEKI